MNSSFNIDTDALSSTVRSAETANDNIAQALNLLNQNVIHQDWAFNGKSNLDDRTREYHDLVAELQRCSSSFYNSLNNASNEFYALEQQIKNQHNSIDELISGVLNVVPKNYLGLANGSNTNVSVMNYDDLKHEKEMMDAFQRELDNLMSCLGFDVTENRTECAMIVGWNFR